MKPLLAGFDQLGYVTNDRQRAIESFHYFFGINSFLLIEARYSAWVEGQEGWMNLRLAFANVDNMQIEIIEPVEDLGLLYGRVLPPGCEFAMALHHLRQLVPGSLENWENHRAALESEQRNIVYYGDVGPDGRFVYTDERARLGHYVEHMWMGHQTLRYFAENVPCHQGYKAA